MKHYTREQLLRESGARPEDLADLEAKGLLVPNRRWRLFGRFGTCEEYYLPGQLEALRLIVKTRRTVEANRRSPRQ